MLKKIKRRLFIWRWHRKNRNWCECRHKRRALNRALVKQGYEIKY